MPRRRTRQEIDPADLLSEGLRIGVWDLETSSLNASFGRLLTAGVKPLGEAPVVLVAKAPVWKDKPLAYQAKKALEAFDVLVSYNGLSFDVRFLNTRLVAAGIRPLRNDIIHIDLLKTVRNRLRLHSNRLQALTEFLGTLERKTPLDPNIWAQATMGDRTALEHVADHNLADLTTLEECFNKLASLVELKFNFV